MIFKKMAANRGETSSSPGAFSDNPTVESNATVMVHNAHQTTVF